MKRRFPALEILIGQLKSKSLLLVGEAANHSQWAGRVVKMRGGLNVHFCLAHFGILQFKAN